MPHANGETIRRARQERGIHVSELAEHIHVSPVHMANIELGHNTASIEVLYRIANRLELPIDALVSEGGGTHPQPSRPTQPKPPTRPARDAAVPA